MSLDISTLPHLPHPQHTRLEIDTELQTVTYGGLTFSLELLYQMASPESVGKQFRIVSNDGGAVTIQTMQAP